MIQYAYPQTKERKEAKKNAVLYKPKRSKFYWVMFRDPKRKGKFIRQSTGTTERSAALEIEKSVSLAVRGKVAQNAMERILRAIYKTTEGLTGMRLEEAWGRYTHVLEQRGKEQGNKTVTALHTELDALVNWAKEKHGIRIVRQVTSEIALEYAAWIKKNGKLLKGGKRGPLKDKSRKNKIAGLSSIWRVLSGIEPEIGDPWRNCIPIVKDSERGKAFTREQEKKILEAAGKGKLPEWKIICIVGRHTGLRKVDVFKLKWSMVDFKRGVIELEPSKTRNYQIAVSIPMVATLRTALEDLRKSGGASEAKKGATSLGKSANEYVFPRFAGAYPNDPWEEDFGKILERAGVKGKGYTFHSYRHTFRTRLKEAGVPDELAKELGGWTQDATLARYNHADETEKLRVMMEKGA